MQVSLRFLVPLLLLAAPASAQIRYYRMDRTPREAMGFVGPVHIVDSHIETVITPGEGVLSTETSRETFSSDGFLVETQSFNAAGEVVFRRVSEYNNPNTPRPSKVEVQNGREKTVSLFDDKGIPTEIAKYNADGTLRSREAYVRDYKTGAEQYTTYDATGRVTASVSHQSVHAPGSNRTVRLENGKVIQEGEINRTPTGTEMRSTTHLGDSTRTTIQVHDQNGHRVITTEPGRTFGTASNKTGQITDTIRIDRDGKETHIIRHFDDRHRVIGEDESHDGVVRHTQNITYVDDDRGNWIKRVSERFLESGRVDTTTTERVITYY